MTGPTIVQEKSDHVRLLKLHRPEAKNAFNNEMYLELAQAIDDASEDEETRVIVITGDGDVFSAGQDLHEMNIPESGEIVGFDRLITSLNECPKPILAAVNGLALGVGVTMLLHTDINYIAKGAKLKCPFVSLGVVPEAGSSYLLSKVLGAQQAAEFLYTSRWLFSDEAVEFGLALEEIPVVRLLQTVLHKAHAIAKMPPEAVQATKALLRKSEHETIEKARKRENEAFIGRLGSPENLEAIAAFFEKRKPDFTKR